MFAEEHSLGILSQTPTQMNLFIAFDYIIFQSLLVSSQLSPIRGELQSVFMPGRHKLEERERTIRMGQKIKRRR